MQTVSLPRRSRIVSIDVLRGFIMLIMALDHVRDFFHEGAMTDSPTNLDTTTPALFFTRWITHFCAPLFLFLSGISAYLSGLRKTKAQLSVYLITRGLWLVIAEIILFNLITSFDVQFRLIFLAVFWAIGWSMILLGLLIHTSYTGVLIAGIVIVFGHNVTDYLPPPESEPVAALHTIFLTARGSAFPMGSRTLVFAYAILPWTGIMLLGYALGYVYNPAFNAARRRILLRVLGFSVIALFIVLRLINKYGDAAPWSQQKNTLYTIFSFLNTSKYPVSLMFTCMTVGPGLVALSFLENASGRMAEIMKVYGKVPFFYFLGHFLVAHVLCVIAFYATGHTSSEIADPRSPFLFRPSQFGFSLGMTYLVWISVLIIMYYPCRWWGRVKERNGSWWVRYL
jgi:uncharacterized membrane protein